MNSIIYLIFILHVSVSKGAWKWYPIKVAEYKFFKLTIYYSLYSCLFFACKPSLLEQSLEKAGTNRVELQKVLDFYKSNDQLKYKAACFLIENMPQYYAYSNEQLEKVKKEIYSLAIEQNCSPSQAFRLLEEKYGKVEITESEKVYDIHIIKADYLINNIEWSFKVWKQSSWGKHISFERFCEEILPYRVGIEPLEDWREQYYNFFYPLLESCLEELNSVSACQFIYAELSKKYWLFDPALQFSGIGPTLLLKNRYGSCFDRCELVVFAMRSVGIPCGIDINIQSPEKRNITHGWNYMIDEKGRCIDFAIEDMYPDTIRQTPHYKRGKVYRKYFSRISYPDYLKSTLFIRINNMNLRDVSADYFPNERIDIPVENTYKVLFLNVFNNESWIPIGYTENKKNKAVFKYIEPGIVYSLSYYKDGAHTVLYVPFLYRGKGRYQFLYGDTTQLQDIELNRKYPLLERMEEFQTRLLGGKFQGANKVNFSDAITFYEIETIPELIYHEIPVNDKRKYKYFRYLSGKGGHCDMAEIQFISENVVLSADKIIGDCTSYWE